MHHQTGLSSINNISIRNRSTDSSVVKIILLKEKTDLKKKTCSPMKLDPWPRFIASPWTAKAIPEYSNRGSRFDLRFEERNMKKGVSRVLIPTHKRNRDK